MVSMIPVIAFRTCIASLPAVLASCSGIDTTPAPLVPVRAAILDDTGTASAGTVDLEFGALVDPNERSAAIAGVNWGAGERTELFLGWAPYLYRLLPLPESDTGGIGNAELGIRHRFRDETDDGPAVLLGLSALVPAGDFDWRDYVEWGGTASVTLTKTLGGVAFNPTYRLTAIGAAEDSSVDFFHDLGVMASGALSDRFFGYGELAANLASSSDQEQLWGQVGGGWFASDRLALDAGVGYAVGDEVPGFYFSFGVTLTFGGGD